MNGSVSPWQRLKNVDPRIWDGLLTCGILAFAQLDLWRGREPGATTDRPDSSSPLPSCSRRAFRCTGVGGDRSPPPRMVSSAGIAYGVLQHPSTELDASPRGGRVLRSSVRSEIGRSDAGRPRSDSRRRRVAIRPDGQLGGVGGRAFFTVGVPVRLRAGRVESTSTARPRSRGGRARRGDVRTRADRTRAARRRRAPHERDGGAGGWRALGAPARSRRGRASAPPDRGVRTARPGGDAAAARPRGRARRRPSRRSRGSRARMSSSTDARHRPRGGARHRGRRATAAAGRRPVRLPHRPGGAHERAEARRDGAHARVLLRYADDALEVEIADDGSEPVRAPTASAAA